MPDRIFGDREKAMEEAYFRQEDAKLLGKLRENASLEDIGLALGEKLQIQNPELLKRVRDLGITVDTAPALFLAPLVQVAWADGSVTRKEQDTVLRLARARDAQLDSAAYAQLAEWLRVRPADAVFDTAIEVLKAGFAVLPAHEREERLNRVVEACREVAMITSGGIAQTLRLGNSVSSQETAMLDEITEALRERS
jgi:tellurite resistance protein